MTAAPERTTVRLPPPPGTDTWHVHVYAHTHWDREWYLPFERYRSKLAGAVDAILDTLARDDAFTCYVLDGQTIVLDDYLALRPERRDELHAAVAAGRLEIGPWYVLPDEFLVSGESLVRNLFEGRRGARAFGHPTPVGYLPDPFGHVAQLPAVLAGFGIPLVIFSRGMDDRFEEVGSHFEWVALDGEQSVTAVVQTGHEQENGYCNASPLAAVRGPGQDGAIGWCDELARYLAPDARLPLMLFAAGADHYSVNPHLPELVGQLDARYENATVRLGSLAEFGEAVGREVERAAHDGRPLAKLRGELRGSRHAPILSSIFSARIHLKQDNVRLQTMLERYVEPVVALAQFGGVHRTEPGSLRYLWRLALQNQPHDSIGGCSVDETHADMPQRTKQALELADDLLREVTVALGCDDRAMVFSPLAAPGGSIVATSQGPRWLDDQGALELRAFDPPATVAAHADDGVIESEVLRVGVSDGRVWIEHRPSGRRFDDVLDFYDEADAGDEYDFGRVAGDVPVHARLAGHSARLLPSGVAELELLHELELPLGLTADRGAREQATQRCLVFTLLHVAGGVPWVECTVNWNNEALDHRLRVRVALGTGAGGTFSDGHFAVLDRPAEAVAAGAGWKQRPTPIRHCESLAGVEALDGSGGIAVLTRGLHEFELGRGADGAAAIDLTILRAVGWLSRDDVAGRPAHAGPALPTPGAQCLGPQRVQFAIAPFAGDRDDAGVAMWAARYVAPPLVLEPLDSVTRGSDSWRYRALDIEARAAGGRELHSTGSPGNAYEGSPARPDDAEVTRRLAALQRALPEVSGLLPSAVKPADDGSGDLVVRGWNPTRRTADARIALPGTEGVEVRFDEALVDGGSIARAVPPGGILTARFTRRA